MSRFRTRTGVLFGIIAILVVAGTGSILADADGKSRGKMSWIVGYDGETIETPWDLTRAVLKSEPGERVEIDIERDGDRQTVRAEIGEREEWVGAFGFGDGGFDFDFNFDFDNLPGRLHERGEFSEERMEHLRERLEEHRMSFDSEEFQERMERLHESLADPDLQNGCSRPFF